MTDVRKEREKARRFWKSLPTRDRNDIGDALVLGDFDWRDWLESKPTRAFLDEVDELRMLWESE